MTETSPLLSGPVWRWVPPKLAVSGTASCAAPIGRPPDPLPLEAAGCEAAAIWEPIRALGVPALRPSRGAEAR
jgi:hypothetical protein